MKKYIDILIIILAVVILGLIIYLLLPHENNVKEIKLDKQELSIYVGDKGIIKATILPTDATDKTVTWKSSNESVATVNNNGIVTAISAGETEISAESSNDIKATCKVKVLIREVLKIDLSKTNITLKIGDKTKLDAVITPTNATYNKINYKSSNESIVTVDNKGNIVAKKEGSAEIIVTDEKGSKEARCKITVSPNVIEVKEIKVNKSSLSITVGNSGTLTATINPSNATNKSITWSSSDSSVASIDNGTIIAKKEGKTTITAKTVNGLTATCVVTVNKASTPTPTPKPTATPKPKSNGINKIHFIKQSSPSDAILIESNNHFAMIDTGYPTSSDNKRVYDYLKSVGVNELDFVLLTHVHKDHTGGFEYIANRIKIDRVYMKEYIEKDHEPAENKVVYKNLKSVINSKKIPVTYVEKTYSDGQGFTFEDMTIKLYNTPQRMNQKGFVGGNENINSIISLITVNNKKIFLTGDSEDNDIMTGIINKVGSVDILKIPHHNYVGCSFLMETARKLDPKHIVITNNKQGTCSEKYFHNNAPNYYVNTTSKNAIVFTIGNTITVDK